MNITTLLIRLQPEGFERHRVVKRRNCDCLFKSSNEATFNLFLMVVFIIILSLTAIEVVIYEQFSVQFKIPYSPPKEPNWDYIFVQTWLYGHLQIGRRGVVLLAIVAAILTVCVFLMKTTKKKGPPPSIGGDTRTICALIQQV